MRVLVLHGWQNHRPPGHWQTWLTAALREHGHDVQHPQLPDADRPVLGTWLERLDRALAARPDLVVCHSLACLLWATAAREGRLAAPVDRLALVAPPSDAVCRSYPEIAAFAPGAPWPDVAATSRARPLVVLSDDDPYAPDGLAPELAGAGGVDVVTLPAQGHLDLEAGYGTWPSLLAWCLDPREPVSPR